jgi:hypothetical protein
MNGAKVAVQVSKSSTLQESVHGAERGHACKRTRYGGRLRCGGFFCVKKTPQMPLRSGNRHGPSPVRCPGLIYRYEMPRLPHVVCGYCGVLLAGGVLLSGV